MKYLILILLATSVASAKNTKTKGYMKKNGTYVQGHNKKSPNKSKLDNYSTDGNVNPYTGKKGSKKPTK